MAQTPGFRSIAPQNSVPAPVSPTVTGRYRRNGKLQSCEPCRKSKLKCDHTVPVCGRCVKRRCVNQCVYHPNPLSQNRQQSARSSSAKNLPTPTSTQYGSPQHVLPSVEKPVPDGPLSGEAIVQVQRNADPHVQAHRAVSAPPFRPDSETVTYTNPQFHGATSYASYITENLSSLGVVSTDLAISKMRSTIIGNDRISQGCRALAFLRHKRSVNMVISKFFEIIDGSNIIAPEPMMKGWMRSLWQHYGDTLESQNPKGLLRLSELLFRNTQTPLVFDGNTTAKEWTDRGTGPNIRWEVIGIIASLVGVCVCTLDASDPLLKEYGINPSLCIAETHESSQACVTFCRDCDAIGDMYLWLVTEAACLTSMKKGDYSYVAYHESGEMVSAVLAMGFHEEIRPNNRVPFFLAEMRKRSFITAYCAEVSMASFLGRPSRLSYRYCNLGSPLDITDQQLVLEPSEIDRILANLDEYGFNKAEKVHRATWQRAWVGFAPIREDVLDLSLGQYTRDEILQRAEIIHQKMEQHWAALPNWIRQARHAQISGTPTPVKRLYLNIIRQGSMSNELLLQRVLIRRTNANPDVLINVASAILKDTLDLSQRHDLLALFKTDIQGILAVHGLRSATIIAVELLKQEQLAVYPVEPLLPRSQTIQDLSVLAARLGAVDPDDGMYSLCQQGRKVITSILDKVLAPPKRVESQPGPANISNPRASPMGAGNVNLTIPGNGTVPNYDPYMSYPQFATPFDLNLGGPDPTTLPESDYQFMQWLETVNWEQSGGGVRAN